ncbi:MAG: sterile alpha motif-like domain-containing protein [Treponema sp.]|nr:sterile alpha motif-like domain-containing protein [Treponema sp.]
MKKGFYQWLKKQKERPDQVGDLARDALLDDTFPKEANTQKRLMSYFEKRKASDLAIASLQLAWDEFSAN